MVNAVSSLAYFSYLNQLQGGETVSAPSPTPSTGPSPAPAPSQNTNNTGASMVSSLLGGGSSPTILSLLQEDGSGTFDPIYSLLGGAKANSALVKLYSDVYASNAAASFQIADMAGKAEKAQAAPRTTGVQDLITQSNAASKNAASELLERVKQDVKDAAYKPDGVSPLVA